MRDSRGRIGSVPAHGAKTLPVSTIKSIIEQAGLKVDEFTDLL